MAAIVHEDSRGGIEFRRIRFAIESIPAGAHVPRHRHLDAYATLILDGAYEQASYAGRLRVAAGDVLVQPTLDCHANRMLSRGVRILRLPWPRDAGFGGVFRIADADTIVKAAIEDIATASALLVSAVRGLAPRARFVDGIGDLLAADLAGDPSLAVGEWAERAGVARESATRGFTRLFGVPPARFGAELRARNAWLQTTASRDRLCEIAADAGFCDQAHMTRAIKRLTGDTPAQWRQSLARPAGAERDSSGRARSF